MGDRVNLADGREKLVAEALALRGAAHQARDIDEGQPRRNDLRGFGNSRQFVEPGIGHRDLADIRLDGAKRIIRRLRRRRFGQRIEQRRLADVGQADDTAFETHFVLSIFSSSWPGSSRPSTSCSYQHSRTTWMPRTRAGTAGK